MQSPVQTKQTRAIEQTVGVAASPETVFRALTDENELPKWWPTSARSEARAGGRFRYEWKFEKSPERDHVQEGTYTDLVAPRLVRYPWALHGQSEPSLVEISVAPEGRGSRVTLRHTGWPMDKKFDELLGHHVQGWAGFLANLKSVLEEGRDIRRDAMGLSTR